MNSIVRVGTAVSLLMLCTNAAADSYARFADMLEIDRHGVFFANVRKLDTDNLERRSSITVWTRMHPDALNRELSQEASPVNQPADAILASGPVTNIFEHTLDRHPRLVRVCSSSIAILDFHAINYGQILREPAIKIFSFDGEDELSIRLDDIFTNGTERYHNGRGLVYWLQDAWFDETGERLFIVSQNHSTNQYGREVAIIDIESGDITFADRDIIKEQISEVEPRFLHSALEVAIGFNVDGIGDDATTIFLDEAMPLPARTRAAVYLSELDSNAEASQFVSELSALWNVRSENVSHPAVSRTLVYEKKYWWNTIGYAARATGEYGRTPDPSE